MVFDQKEYTAVNSLMLLIYTIKILLTKCEIQGMKVLINRVEKKVEILIK